MNPLHHEIEEARRKLRQAEILINIALGTVILLIVFMVLGALVWGA